MQYEIKDFFLEFKTPFAIAHGTRTGTDVVLLTITHDGISTIGEASLPPYLPGTKESVRKFIDDFFEVNTDLPENIHSSINLLHTFAAGNTAAKACMEIALWNWYAAKAKMPLWKLLGLNNHPLPDCTYTLGMGSEEEIQSKISDSREFKILKVKLGSGDMEYDKQMISTIRKYTNKSLCVDANQGWKQKEDALSMISWLSERNVKLIEQPLPKNAAADQLWLFERSPLPLFADESVQGPEDIDAVSKLFHGINIKLMKCGGISKAMQMIQMARKLKLQVMIGSMSETGCAIMAAAQLSSLADIVDLDGPMLTKNNPFDVVRYVEGKVMLDDWDDQFNIHNS